MLTREEKDYLSKIDPNRKVTIHIFDPNGKALGEAIVKQIKKHFPNLKVLFMGSVALEISGQRDIDIYALANPEEFDRVSKMIFLENTSITHLEYDEEKRSWRIHCLNDSSHLENFK